MVMGNNEISEFEWNRAIQLGTVIELTQRTLIPTVNLHADMLLGNVVVTNSEILRIKIKIKAKATALTVSHKHTQRI